MVFWARSPFRQTSGADGSDVTTSLFTNVVGRRLSPRGEPVWNSDRSLVPGDAGAFYRNPAAASDGTGGAIVAFEVVRLTVDGSAMVDIVAQRVGSDGSLLWGEGAAQPVPVGTSDLPETHPAVVSDGDGGAIVAYEVTLATG